MKTKSAKKDKSYGWLKSRGDEVRPEVSNYVVTPIYDEHLLALKGKTVKWDGEVEDDRATKCLHPSSFSSCARALQYEWLEVKVPNRIPVKLQRTFAVGHYLHRMVQCHLKDAGLMVFDEVPVIHRKYRIAGKTDGLLCWQLEDYYALLEFKTINPREFETLYAPKPDHLIQGNCYIMCTENERKLLRNGKIEAKNKFQKVIAQIDHPITQANFLYWNKANSEIKEFVVHRDKEIVAQIKRKAVEILDALREERLLPRLSDDPSEKGCSNCKYRFFCFDKFSSEQVDWRKVGVL